MVFVSAAADTIQADSLQSARDFGLRIAGILTRPIDPYRLHALLLSNPVSPRMEKRLATIYPTAQELEQALRDGELHTEYQPKTDLATGEIVGVEALARWHSPTLGIIPPSQFVAVAEQSDLISRLTFRILEEAIAACRRWRMIQALEGTGSSLPPVATIRSASSGRGRCSAMASSHGARIQASRSSVVVRMTGIAFG